MYQNQFLAGQSILLVELDPELAFLRAQAEEAGAEVVPLGSPAAQQCSHVAVAHKGHKACEWALSNGKHVVSFYWLWQSLEAGHMLPVEADMLHRPLPGLAIPASEVCQVTLTGFQGHQRQIILAMMRWMGVEVQKNMALAVTTHVVAKDVEDTTSQKLNVARKPEYAHRISIVNVDWVYDSLRQWTIQPSANYLRNKPPPESPNPQIVEESGSTGKGSQQRTRQCLPGQQAGSQPAASLQQADVVLGTRSDDFIQHAHPPSAAANGHSLQLGSGSKAVQRRASPVQMTLTAALGGVQDMLPIHAAVQSLETAPVPRQSTPQQAATTEPAWEGGPAGHTASQADVQAGANVGSTTPAVQLPNAALPARGSSQRQSVPAGAPASATPASAAPVGQTLNTAPAARDGSQQGTLQPNAAACTLAALPAAAATAACAASMGTVPGNDTQVAAGALAILQDAAGVTASAAAPASAPFAGQPASAAAVKHAKADAAEPAAASQLKASAVQQPSGGRQSGLPWGSEVFDPMAGSIPSDLQIAAANARTAKLLSELVPPSAPTSPVDTSPGDGRERPAGPAADHIETAAGLPQQAQFGSSKPQSRPLPAGSGAAAANNLGRTTAMYGAEEHAADTAAVDADMTDAEDDGPTDLDQDAAVQQAYGQLSAGEATTTAAGDPEASPSTRQAAEECLHETGRPGLGAAGPAQHPADTDQPGPQPAPKSAAAVNKRKRNSAPEAAPVKAARGSHAGAEGAAIVPAPGAKGKGRKRSKSAAAADCPVTEPAAHRQHAKQADVRALLAARVCKEFDGGEFKGQVIGYDPVAKFYMVEFEDGDREEMSSQELQGCLVAGDQEAGAKSPAGDIRPVRRRGSAQKGSAKQPAAATQRRSSAKQPAAQPADAAGAPQAADAAQASRPAQAAAAAGSKPGRKASKRQRHSTDSEVAAAAPADAPVAADAGKQKKRKLLNNKSVLAGTAIGKAPATATAPAGRKQTSRKGRNSAASDAADAAAEPVGNTAEQHPDTDANALAEAAPRAAAVAITGRKKGKPAAADSSAARRSLGTGRQPLGQKNGMALARAAVQLQAAAEPAAAAPSVSPAPRTADRPGRRPFFALSGMHSDEQARCTAILKQLSVGVISGKVSHRWESRVTHVVMPSLMRSGKTLAGLAAGNWILGSSYLDECQSARRLIEEEQHELQESETGLIASGAPMHWRQRRDETGHGAFYGLRVVVHGTLDKTGPDRDHIVQIVEAGGGSVVGLAEAVGSRGAHVAVIKATKAKGDAGVKKLLAVNIACVAPQWVVQWVADPWGLLEKHRLFGSKASSELAEFEKGRGVVPPAMEVSQVW